MPATGRWARRFTTSTTSRPYQNACHGDHVGQHAQDFAAETNRAGPPPLVIAIEIPHIGAAVDVAKQFAHANAVGLLVRSVDAHADTAASRPAGYAYHGFFLAATHV